LASNRPRARAAVAPHSSIALIGAIADGQFGHPTFFVGDASQDLRRALATNLTLLVDAVL
jgi:hypothetical protein